MSSIDKNPSTEGRIVSFSTSGKSTRSAELLKKSNTGGPGSDCQRKVKSRFLKKMQAISDEYKAEFLLLYYFPNIARPDCSMKSCGTVAEQFEIKDTMKLTKAEFLVDCEKKYRQQKSLGPIPAVTATGAQASCSSSSHRPPAAEAATAAAAHIPHRPPTAEAATAAPAYIPHRLPTAEAAAAAAAYIPHRSPHRQPAAEAATVAAYIPHTAATSDPDATVAVEDDMNGASGSSRGDAAAILAQDHDAPLLVPSGPIAPSPAAQPPLKRRATGPAAMVSPLMSAQGLVHPSIRLPGGARPFLSFPSGHPAPSINSTTQVLPVAVVRAPHNNIFQSPSSVPSPLHTQKGKAGCNDISLSALTSLPFISAGVVRPMQPPGGARPASASLPLARQQRPTIKSAPRAPVAVVQTPLPSQKEKAGCNDKYLSAQTSLPFISAGDVRPIRPPVGARPAMANLPLVHQCPINKSVPCPPPVAVVPSPLPTQKGKRDGNIALKNYLGSLFQ